LPRAQDDPHRLVAQLPPDVIHEVEAGAVALHHHVEEDHGDVPAGFQEAPSLLRGIGRQDLEALVVEDVVGEGEAGALVDGRVVVDDRDHPWGVERGGRRLVVVVDDVENVVVVGH
jgi:uncharacterized protein (DUF849 family)